MPLLSLTMMISSNENDDSKDFNNEKKYSKHDGATNSSFIM